ncbi:MAG: hypothetical protein ACTSYI_03525 [Promethearchaeota archaeon]
MEVNLEEVSILVNTDLFQKANLFGENILMVENNTYSAEVDPTSSKPLDDIKGKVYMFDTTIKTGSFSCEMQFLQNHIPDKAPWMGVVFRAQDMDNYELVWIMPLANAENIAHISVAHGIVPWWSEAYEQSKKATIALNEKDWNMITVQMEEEVFTVSVNQREAFTKRYAYYLKEGKVGVFLGTGTDATFKNFHLKKSD